MHFGSPVYLLTLLIVPLTVLLAVLVQRRRSRYPVAYTNLELLASVAGSRVSRRSWIPLALLALALALAGGAVAHPKVKITKPEQHSVVVLLVDVSGSMQANDVRPTRIQAAVDAMHLFVSRLPNSAEVGLVEFSTTPAVVTTPTTDHSAVTNALDLLGPEGATALGDGIGAAVQVVKTTLAQQGFRRVGNEDVPGAIVLLSDGAQNRGTLQPLQAAHEAKEAGIRIDTVAFGTPQGTVQFEGIPGVVPVPPDPATMRAVASATGGQMYDARSAVEATSIYKKLGSTVARKSQWDDLSSWFSLGAGIVLLSALTAGMLLSPTLP